MCCAHLNTAVPAVFRSILSHFANRTKYTCNEWFEFWEKSLAFINFKFVRQNAQNATGNTYLTTKTHYKIMKRKKKQENYRVINETRTTTTITIKWCNVSYTEEFWNINPYYSVANNKNHLWTYATTQSLKSKPKHIWIWSKCFNGIDNNKPFWLLIGIVI